MPGGASEPSWYEARVQDGRRPAVSTQVPGVGCQTPLPPANDMVPVLGDNGRTSFGPKQTLACSTGNEVPKVDKNCGLPGRVSQLPTVRLQKDKEAHRTPEPGPTLAVTSADTYRGLLTAVPRL